ncbi:putative glutathione ABC transporter, permease protein GsiC [Selenomonas sp. oral taxon 892 str. F0426]|uniref:ABC transporter permease n=1 Tax=Selenomonas sp. oral taxon 892 TaxID=1321785 RepID=UPI0003AD4E25|nr:ABC transporter permease [Selenomonas sp. oral taxon 892]ERJ95734.1 putative glutathione ABC transporter, permease protein GsiC [Selenomonas sp. oral taxon 892 str. F0426]
MAMTMLQRYICRRLLGIVPVLLGISLLSFVLAQLSPGDPAQIILESAGGVPKEADVEALRSYLGLDEPAYVQYGLWLWRLLHGDGGISYHLGMPVFDALLARLPVTFALALAALVWAVVFGIGLGLLMARLRGTIWEVLMRGMTQIMLSAPSFLTAILLILVFGVWLHVLPTNGVESAAGYILPSLALALVTLAMTAQLLDSQLRDALGSFYAQTARLRGLSEARVLLTCALPNALVPVTAMLGNFFAAVLGGAIIVETVFALPGIGSLALEAIHYRDYPLLQGYVLFLGAIYVGVTIVVDIVLAHMDPRIVLGGER